MMKNSLFLFFLASVLSAVLLSGCAEPQHWDYMEYRRAKPGSILILPPIVNCPDVSAGNSFASWSSLSIGNEGYYIFPVALTLETFRQNGVTEAAEVQKIPWKKLYEVFGADAAMYITVDRYGQAYYVTNSVTEIDVKARLVDLHTGKLLWKASYLWERSGGGGIDPIALVLTAVNQVVDTLNELAHKDGKMVADLLYRYNDGIMRGPLYPKDGPYPDEELACGVSKGFFTVVPEP